MEPEPEFYWCLHCERVYSASEWASKKWHCPSGDCDGGRLDAWGWDRTGPMDDRELAGQNLRDRHPEYPVVPERGKVYPLH